MSSFNAESPKPKEYTTYIINMDRSTDRWQAMQEGMQKAGVTNYVRVPGVDGKKLAGTPYQKLVDPEAWKTANSGVRADHDQHNLGSLGCYFSHLRAWQAVVDSGKSFAMIMEDDSRVDADSARRVNSVLDAAPSGWDALIVGQHGLINRPKKAKYFKGWTFYSPGLFWGLSAYFITAHACKYLLKRAYPVKIQVDWFLSSYHRQLTLWVVPGCMKAGGFKSEIKHSPLVVPKPVRRIGNSEPVADSVSRAAFETPAPTMTVLWVVVGLSAAFIAAGTTVAIVSNFSGKSRK
jgi:GR25 family glycosyltransferase involved in LPS biosynthesis